MLYQEMIFKPKSQHVCNPNQYDESKSKWAPAKHEEFNGDYEFLYDDLYEICEYGCGKCCFEMIRGVIDSYPSNKQRLIAKKILEMIYTQIEDENTPMPPSLSFMFTELRHHPDFDNIYPRAELENDIKLLSAPRINSSFERSTKMNDDDFKDALETCYSTLKNKGYIETTFIRFRKIFNNEKIEHPVIWCESMSSLYYFMKQLIPKGNNGIIKNPNSGIWKTTAYCFIDKKNSPFIVNHKTKLKEVSKKAKKDIPEAIKFLSD